MSLPREQQYNTIMRSSGGRVQLVASYDQLVSVSQLTLTTSNSVCWWCWYWQQS